MTDLSSNKTYAVKVIPHSRVAKPHQREKVGPCGCWGAGLLGGSSSPVLTWHCCSLSDHQ